MHGSAADGASTCATDAASRSLSVPAAAAAGTGPLPFDVSVVSATSPDVCSSQSMAYSERVTQTG